MNLGKNIRTLRNNNLLSQEKFAENMKFSRQVISKWENGISEPAINDIISISEMFGITIDELILGNIEPLSFKLDKTRLNFSKRAKNEIAMIEETGANDDMLLPFVKLESLTAYEAFREAYNINEEIDRTGDTSNILDMMNLYEEAFDDGLVEAGINILHIVVTAIMNSKASNPKKELIFQDRLECYMKVLEESGNPAGGFYRAFVLIYGLMITEKTEEENFDDGLILMYKLANEGNELAMKYLDYIEDAKKEE